MARAVWWKSALFQHTTPSQSGLSGGPLSPWMRMLCKACTMLAEGNSGACWARFLKVDTCLSVKLPLHAISCMFFTSVSVSLHWDSASGGLWSSDSTLRFLAKANCCDSTASSSCRVRCRGDLAKAALFSDLALVSDGRFAHDAACLYMIVLCGSEGILLVPCAFQSPARAIKS